MPAKHHVVALDSWVEPPELDFEHELTQYPSTNPDELAERMKDATIVVISNTRMTSAGIANAPKLQLIACNSTGTDHVDKEAVRKHGVSLCRVPAQNTDSVSEHAFALHYAVRRQIISLHDIAIGGASWPTGPMLRSVFGAPPRTNGEETLVVIGYGAIGKNIAKIGSALGMQVLVAERKGAFVIREGRVSFDQALKTGTIFMLVMPADETTVGMFGADEFDAMNRTSIIINVGRGGVIDEAELARALREGRIGGAATDVFQHEPPTRDSSPLLEKDIPNLVLSPHIAWYSSRTIEGTRTTAKANIEAFVRGMPQNIVIAVRHCP